MLSEMEVNELSTRVKAMTNEEKRVVASALPEVLIAEVLREKLQASISRIQKLRTDIANMGVCE